MTAARILIVDDHALARAGLKFVLEQGGFEIAGEASSGEQAVELTQQLTPDVVLMDVRLGEGIDGLEATRRIAAMDVGARIIMLTLHDMPGYVREALAAGASGYVLKDTGIEELRQAIATVLAGQVSIPADLVRAAMRPETNADRGGDLALLTDREKEILDGVAEGMTNKEIARRLEISPATVKAHVERIIAKLGVADRTQAAVAAVRQKSSRK